MRTLTIVLFLFSAMSLSAKQRMEPDVPTPAAAAMRWRLVGPFRGGRVVAVAGVTSEPHTYYFGAVAGGVWKTTDGGIVWTPVFDAQPVQSIGAIAVAPSNPAVIYAGTGESDWRSDLSSGDGLYRSADAGRTWQHVGLENTRHIARIAIDPRNPDDLLVAAMGHAYDANPDRGVFRSQDGGRTWQKVLFRNDDVGAIDVVRQPSNPDVVYAALWSARRTPWSRYPPVNGPGGGIFKSTNNGATWTALTGNGLPAPALGRIGLAVGYGDRKSPLRADRCRQAGTVSLGRQRSHLATRRNRSAYYVAGVVLLRNRRGSAQCGHRLCAERRPQPIHRRRKHVDADQRRAGR